MNILVVGPHPDDELLGCGGSLLRWKSEGHRVMWCLVTADPDLANATGRQDRQVRDACSALGLQAHDFTWLKFRAAELDKVPLKDLVQRLHEVFTNAQPETVLVPFGLDAHSDHQIVSSAATAACKWFRQSSIQRVLAYETLSETDQGLSTAGQFVPNVFVDVSSWINEKLEMLKIYSEEVGDFPFPRSAEAIQALALVRGAASGFEAAEAFMLLRERSPSSQSAGGAP